MNLNYCHVVMGFRKIVCHMFDGYWFNVNCDYFLGGIGTPREHF